MSLAKPADFTPPDLLQRLSLWVSANVRTPTTAVPGADIARDLRFLAAREADAEARAVAFFQPLQQLQSPRLFAFRLIGRATDVIAPRFLVLVYS